MRVTCAAGGSPLPAPRAAAPAPTPRPQAPTPRTARLRSPPPTTAPPQAAATAPPPPAAPPPSLPRAGTPSAAPAPPPARSAPSSVNTPHSSAATYSPTLCPSIPDGSSPHDCHSRASAHSVTNSAGCAHCVCCSRSPAPAPFPRHHLAKVQPQDAAARAPRTRPPPRGTPPRPVEPLAHPELLRPLTREQERHPPFPGHSRFPATRLPKRQHRIRCVTHHHRPTVLESPTPHLQRPGHVPEIHCLALRQVLPQPLPRPLHRPFRLPRQHQKLEPLWTCAPLSTDQTSLPRRSAALPPRRFRGRRLLQHHVRVRPPDPERAHPSPPQPLPLPHAPRVHVERARREVDLRVRPLVVEARRNLPVLHAQDRLDQPRDPRRRVQVADVRLHRAERAEASRDVCSRNACVSAATSIGSPSAVPVPCAST